MRIIPPVTVTASLLTATNVPESSYPEYDGTASYSAGDRVHVSATQRVYQASVDVTGVYPPDNVGTEGASWVEVGANNRWAMFDGLVGTGSASSAAWPVGDGQGIQVEVTPGAVVNGVALFGLEAESVTVEVVDPVEGLVYSATQSLVATDGIDNWFEWFFTPIESRADIVFTDLPSFGTATIRVSIQSSGTARCSLLVMGLQRTLGRLKWEPSVGITDYSKKERDTWGSPVIVPRAFSKMLSADVDIDTPRVSAAQRLLARYRTTELVWLGAERYESTILYGYYRNFSIVMRNAIFSECSIDIEGLSE